MNNLENILVYLVLALNLILGSIVLLSDPKKKNNQIFAAMVFSIIIWISVYFFENQGFSKPISSIFLRADFIFANIVSYFWFIFCLNFSETSFSKKRFYSLYLGIIPVIFAFLFLTDLVINNFRIVNNVIIFDRGLLYFFYVAFIFFYMFGGCSILFYRYKKVEHIMKQQIIYILVGAFLTLVTVIFITLILPQILDISVNIARLGIYGILFLVAFTAYAIVKYQLFNIKVILTETAVGLVVLVMLIQVLLSENQTQMMINGTMLILVSYGGYLIIKSVLVEIKQKEKLQTLSTQLSESNTHLKDLDKMKDEFLQMATHELNTPISVIQGKLSMIMDEDMGGFGPEQKKFLGSVSENSKRLAQMARDLLSVERIDQNRVMVTLDEVDLTEMVSKIVADLVPRAKLKNDVLTLETPGKLLPKIMIDQNKIAEVFNNLIVNATKFTENGTIKVKVELKDDQILVSISDTGIGIDKDGQTHLFEKFHQVGRFAPQNPIEQQGTGLGLYISKKLIELHHGKIWLESEAGHGTTFYFTLPVKQNKQKDEVKNG